MLDVVVDIRKGSPTYGQHVECLLSGRDGEGVRIAKELGSAIFKPSYFSHQPSLRLYHHCDLNGSPSALIKAFLNSIS